MDKFCSECGSPVEAQDEFCTQCGHKLQKSESGIAQKPINNIVSKPNKQRGLILLVIAVLIITVGSGVYLYRKFNSRNALKDKTNSEYTVNNTPSTETNKVPNQAEISAEQNNTTSKWENPDVYLPALNKKYTYYNKYVDGDEGTLDVVVGHIDGRAMLSMSSMIPQSEAFTEHVVKRDDGIYLVSDGNPEAYTKYLPNKIIEGASWENSGISFKIEKVNVSCDMGFKTFENCIVVKQNFAEAGYAFRVWYAPEVGVIKSVYADSGSDYQKLTGITDMKENEIKQLLLRYSPNISKIK